MHEKSTTMTDEEFSAVFPVTRNDDLARRLGVSVPTISRRARRLGLQKDQAFRYAHTRHAPSAETRAKMSAAQKGRTFSDETRAKMSAAQVGRVLPPEWRANISKGSKGKTKPPGFAEQARGRHLPPEENQARYDRMAERGTLARGARHYNWKGGLVAKPFARCSDRRHRLWREAVLTRDGYTCQKCERVFAPGQRGLHAHHLKPFARYISVRYDPANGVALCTRCHRSYHTIITVEDYERIAQVPCACGCGEMMYPITEGGKPRRYLRYHCRRGAVLSEQTRSKIRSRLKGRKLGPRGWTNAYVTQEQFIALWPTTTSRDLAALCHWTESNVRVWGKKLGLPPRYRRGANATE